jgi:GGDEF domain-containing protein
MLSPELCILPHLAAATPADLAALAPAGTGDALFTAALVLGGLLLALGAARLVRRHQPASPLADAPQPTAATAPPAPPPEAGLARRLCTAFDAWLVDSEEQPDLWTALDQWLREVLAEQLGVTRVRCYHVRPGADQLEPLARTGSSTAAPSARAGLLGHVVATGSEFVAGDPAQGELVLAMAQASGEAWSWVWPIRRPKHGTIGVVALGPAGERATLTAEVRRTVGPLLSLFWQQAACLERLQVVQRTDQASGVLTRQDFFGCAAAALADSYAASEPVVLLVLALEGLRRLDDRGRWCQRDRLVERLGKLITRRIRSDDLVGRFSDDRFVVLLRRLDSGLGRLIAEKTLAAANACAEECYTAVDADAAAVPDPRGAAADGAEGAGPEAAGATRASSRPFTLRMGLAGSGLTRPPLEALLVTAFDAVERARRTNQPIGTDLDSARPARTPEHD